MSAQPSNAKRGELQLPISRVKSIMKRADNVESIGGDGLFLVAKAAELFIHHLTSEAHGHANKGNSLDYKHFAEAVQTSGAMDFLHEIVPRKITVRKFKELVAAKEAAEHSSSAESSSDSDSDSQTDSDSHSDNDSVEEEHDNDDSSSDGEDNKINGKSESSKSDSDSKSGCDDEVLP